MKQMRSLISMSSMNGLQKNCYNCLVGAQPSPCCSFARHLVGKMVIIAHLLITKHSPILVQGGIFLFSFSMLPHVRFVSSFLGFTNFPPKQPVSVENGYLQNHRSYSTSMVDLAGSLYYQPKQCILRANPPKITIDLHCFIPPI